MAIYTPPQPPAPKTDAQAMADNIRARLTALAETCLSEFANIKGYYESPPAGTTKAQVLAALGAGDTTQLNAVPAKLRAFLVAIDASLGAKFDLI